MINFTIPSEAGLQKSFKEYTENEGGMGIVTIIDDSGESVINTRYVAHISAIELHRTSHLFYVYLSSAVVSFDFSFDGEVDGEVDGCKSEKKALLDARKARDAILKGMGG